MNPEDYFKAYYGVQNDYISEDVYVKKEEEDDYLTLIETNFENDLIELELSKHDDEYYGIIGTEKIYDYETLQNEIEQNKDIIYYSTKHECEKDELHIKSECFDRNNHDYRFCLYNIYLEIEKINGNKFDIDEIYNLFDVKIELVANSGSINEFNLIVPIIKSSVNNVSMLYENKFFVELFDLNKLNNGLGITKYLVKYGLDIRLKYKNMLKYNPHYIFRIHNRYRLIDIDIQHKVFNQKKNIIARKHKDKDEFKYYDYFTDNINEDVSHDDKTNDIDKFSNELIINSWSSNYWLKNSNNILNMYWSHPTQFIIFYIMRNKIEDDTAYIDTNYRTVNSVGIKPNGLGYIEWSSDELIQIEILGVPIYIICLDPQFRDINKFKKYMDCKINHKTCIGVNFSKVDNIKFKIDIDNPFDDYSDYNISIYGLHTNILRQGGGLLGLSFVD